MSSDQAGPAYRPTGPGMGGEDRARRGDGARRGDAGRGGQRRRFARLGSSVRIVRSRSRSRSTTVRPGPSGTWTEHRAPRIDHHAAAEAGAARIVVAGLSGGRHEALVLDRPRPQQNLPVVPPGVHHERRRNDQQVRAALDGESPVQLREAQVVADRQADPQALDVHHHRFAARAPPSRTPGRTPDRGSPRRTGGSSDSWQPTGRTGRRPARCSRYGPGPARPRGTSRRPARSPAGGPPRRRSCPPRRRPPPRPAFRQTDPDSRRTREEPPDRRRPPLP